MSFGKNGKKTGHEHDAAKGEHHSPDADSNSVSEDDESHSHSSSHSRSHSHSEEEEFEYEYADSDGKFPDEYEYDANGIVILSPKNEDKNKKMIKGKDSKDTAPEIKMIESSPD